MHAHEGSLGAETGHQVAWEQFTLPVPQRIVAAAENANLSPVTLKEGTETWQIEGGDFAVEFERDSGALLSYESAGKSLLADSARDQPLPLVQAFRAPTDNDKGFGKWLAKNWQNAGLDKLTPKTTSIESVTRERSLVELKTANELLCAGGSIQSRQHWLVRGDGTMELQCEFSPTKSLPPLPRIGIRIPLAKGLERLQWLGWGPDENYSDRHAACPLGVWSSFVGQQYFPYPPPPVYGQQRTGSLDCAHRRTWLRAGRDFPR